MKIEKNHEIENKIELFQNLFLLGAPSHWASVCLFQVLNVCPHNYRVPQTNESPFLINISAAKYWIFKPFFVQRLRSK